MGREKSLINWKLFSILLLASTFGVIAIIPYILTLQADLLKEIPIPLHILLPIQILQNAVMFAVFIFIGLCLAKRVGLGVPVLEGWLEGKEVKAYLKSIFSISILLGVLVAVLITGIDSFLSTFLGPITIAQIPPIWQRFLACFYGGISEEVFARLFLMSLLAWIFYKIKRTKEDKPTNLGMWLAIIIAAILFGIGHLPFAATLTPLTNLLIARIILLNSIGGIVFGWLYWRKGLESAMLSHFSANITLHVAIPLLA